MNIEALRVEIQRNYEALCERYSLPSKFNFDALVSAVKKGGKGMDESSSYVRMRDKIVNIIVNNEKDNEEINDVL